MVSNHFPLRVPTITEESVLVPQAVLTLAVTLQSAQDVIASKTPSIVPTKTLSEVAILRE